MTVDHQHPPLSPHWLQAALLGSLWASNEIIIGSFLHNLKVPFAGTVLASLGVCILTAGLRIWNDSRILWRAGVICALMKSVSPSAVILGPMVGIMLEALLFWVSVVLFRSHPIGIGLGAILATVAPMIQKLVGLIVTYGLDVARLFVALFETLTRGLSFESISVETAVIIFVALTAVPGLLAAAIGVRAARAVRTTAPSDVHITPTTHPSGWASASAEDRYHLPFLAVHAVLLVAGLLGLSFLPLWGSFLFVVVYALFTLSRYPRIRRRFSQIRLWIEVMVVALLAGLFLGQLSNGHGGWSWAGLQTGFHMAVRALFVVLSFSAISIELRNPVVGRWFLRQGLGSVSRSLEVAFEALPTMTAALGEQQRFLRHPLAALTRMVGSAVSLIPHFQRLNGATNWFLILLTGHQGSGKTTLLEKVTNALRADGMRVGGVLSQVVYHRNEREGYDALDIATGQRRPLCRQNSVLGAVKVGPFSFDGDVLQQINDALRRVIPGNSDVVIIDEVGPLELSGGGWAPALDHLFSERRIPVILTVRPQLAEQVCAHWQCSPTLRWDTVSTDEAAASADVQKLLQSTTTTLGNNS